MQEPIFNTGKQYLTHEEAAIVEAFVEKLPKLDHRYVVDDVTYIPKMYRYPLGAITHATRFIETEEDGTQNYITPLAMLTFPPSERKEPKVWVDVQTKDGTQMVIMKATKWLKLTKNAVIEPPPADTKTSDEAQIRLAQLKAKAAQGVIDTNAPVDFAQPEDAKKTDKTKGGKKE